LNETLSCWHSGRLVRIGIAKSRSAFLLDFVGGNYWASLISGAIGCPSITQSNPINRRKAAESAIINSRYGGNGVNQSGALDYTKPS
jgi:hypothetical protein